MSIDFFNFDTFTVSSEFSLCEFIASKIQKVDATSVGREGAVTTLTTLVDSPSSIRGQPFILMLKAVSESEVLPRSQEALGYVSIIAHDRPEAEANQMSGASIELTSELYKRFFVQVSAASSGLRLKLRTRFPRAKPCEWCAMGLLEGVELRRKGRPVASISLKDLHEGRVSFGD